MLVRTQLQLDDDLYESLRLRAYRERKSMSTVARELLRGALLPPEAPARGEEPGFSFVGPGSSGRSDISERHDDYLAEDFA